MSGEPVRFDLNSDAGFGGQENDVNFHERVVKKTPIELVNGRSVVHGHVVGEFRVLEGSNPLVVNGLGEERELKGVGRISDFEKRLGSAGKQFDDEVGGLCLGGSMANVAALGVCGNGEGVCLKEGRERTAEVRALCFIRDGIDINVCPEDNVNVHVNQDKVSAIRDGDHMVIDSPDEASLSQTICGEGSGEVAALNLVNQSGPIDLVVDLNKCMSADRDVSIHINAESDAPRSAFRVSDLVWGKVRSHPWWPGQIFESAAASKTANKYVRENTHLVAYFGDKTFAWNDVSRIKPFRAHFSDMENQICSDDFRYAVDCAFEEIARRTELGLACSCICKEVYAGISHQEVVNAGIRREARRRDGGDRFSDATFFKPLQLIDFVKGLARSPQYDRVGTLQLVTSKSQLLAYYRWKGYYELPQFQVLGGWLASAAEVSIPYEVKQTEEMSEMTFHCAEVDCQVASADCKLFSLDGASHKRNCTPEADVSSIKKEKRLSDLMFKAHLNKQSGKKRLYGKLGSKPSGSARCAKRKSNDSCFDDFEVKHRKSYAVESADASLQPNQGFRVGSSILKVVGQMNVSTPIMKHKLSHNSAVDNMSSAGGKSQGKEISQTDESCPNDMLSELLWAAIEPMESFTCLTCVSFFAEFRNFVTLDGKNYETLVQAIEQVTKDEAVDTTMLATKLGIARTLDMDRKEDTYWDERIKKCYPEESLAAMVIENGNPNITGQSDVESVLNLGMEQVEKLVIEAEKAASLSQVDESGNDDPSPTALILNFSNLESVPMEENLNEIFSRYGPLNESETEVLKKSNRAKVVFKKRADAEIAFSSAGKYRIFGPSLISYRLRYLPSKPSKASSNSKRKNQEKRKS